MSLPAMSQSKLPSSRIDPELKGRTLYVSPSGDNSDFGRGFQSMLISKLVNGGLGVATKT
jgi:hypothetical protein